MKKINTYSAQKKSSQNNPIKIKTIQKIGKKITKDRQEFVNNIAACGFIQFHA